MSFVAFYIHFFYVFLVLFANHENFTSFDLLISTFFPISCPRDCIKMSFILISCIILCFLWPLLLLLMVLSHLAARPKKKSYALTMPFKMGAQLCRPNVVIFVYNSRFFFIIFYILSHIQLKASENEKRKTKIRNDVEFIN